MSLEGIIKGTKKFIGTTILGLTLACAQGGNLIQTQQGCVTDTDCNADLGRYCNYDTGECEGGEVEVECEFNPDILDVCDEVDNNCDGKVDELGCGTLFIKQYNGGFYNIFSIDLSTFTREDLTSVPSHIGNAYELSNNKRYVLTPNRIFDLETDINFVIENDFEGCSFVDASFFEDDTLAYVKLCVGDHNPPGYALYSFHKKTISGDDRVIFEFLGEVVGIEVKQTVDYIQAANPATLYFTIKDADSNTTDLYRLDVENGEAERITENKNIYPLDWCDSTLIYSSFDEGFFELDGRQLSETFYGTAVFNDSCSQAYVSWFNPETLLERILLWDRDYVVDIDIRGNPFGWKE